MRFSIHSSALLVAPLLLVLAPRAEQITFHPHDDSKLAKKLTIKAELELGDVTLDVSGQDLSGQIPQVSLSGELSTEFVDHYLKVENGKPLELVREFARSKAEGSALDESDSADDFLELDGKQVRFKWNADEKRYDLSFAVGEGKPDDLVGLGIDMDLCSLLPGKPVSVGDKWSVEGKQLAQALVMGIDFEHLPLPEHWSDLGDDAEGAKVLGVIETDLLPQLEKFGDKFKSTCEYTGKRKVGDREMAVIKLDLDFTGSIDMGWFMGMAMKEAEVDESDFKIESASLGMTIKGEGELLWDLEAGHVQAFDINPKFNLAGKLVMSAKSDGQDLTIHGDAELTGNVHWTLELQ